MPFWTRRATAALRKLCVFSKIVGGSKQGKAVAYVFEKYTQVLSYAQQALYFLNQAGRISVIKSVAWGVDPTIQYSTFGEIFNALSLHGRVKWEGTNQNHGLRQTVERSLNEWSRGESVRDTDNVVPFYLQPINLILKPFDIIPLIPIVERAGGIVTNWEGGDPRVGGRIIAAGDPHIHAAAIAVLLFIQAWSRGMLWTRSLQRAALKLPGLGGAVRTLVLARFAWALELVLVPVAGVLLVIYWVTTLGIPLANGAYTQGVVFWEHAAFVFLTPLVLMLPLAVINGLRIRYRS